MINCEAVIDLLSPARVRVHEYPGSQDALRAYESRTRDEAKAWELVGHCEVILRNAMCRELAARFGPDWHKAPDLLERLTPASLDELAKAGERCKKNAGFRHGAARGRVEPGHLVAELNFGFWRFLLSRTYDRSLWVPALNRAFPNRKDRLQGGDRDALYKEVEAIHRQRNRLAHHEPLQGSRADLEVTILRVVGSIGPDAEDWVQLRRL